jgi:hypothetical protein
MMRDVFSSTFCYQLDEDNYKHIKDTLSDSFGYVIQHARSC